MKWSETRTDCIKMFLIKTKSVTQKKKGKSVSEGSQREMGSLEKRIQRTEWIFKYCESRNWRSTEENNQKKSVFLQPFNEQGKTNF